MEEETKSDTLNRLSCSRCSPSTPTGPHSFKSYK